MDLIHFLIDFILHIDVHLAELVAQYGVWVYAILFLILFCETGLVVTPFLPGDSLLFVAGALSALPTNDLNVHLMVLLMVIAAIVGGFTSLPGAIVGGVVIGVVESFSGFYLPDGFKDTAAYIVVLIMLMLKPNGLFGEKLRKKV